MRYIRRMTYLEKFPDDVKDILISLPYRVGQFISESDQTGGDESDDVEQKALENIVTFYAEDTVKGEFPQEVMLEMLKRKSEWENWNTPENIHKVPEQCLRLNEMLKDEVGDKQIQAFKQNLIDIAIVIAQAYCEFDATASAVSKIEVHMSLFMRRMRMMLAGAEMTNNTLSISISPAERSAIKMLADNMGIKVAV